MKNLPKESKRRENVWIIKNAVEICVRNAKMYKPEEKIETQYTPPTYYKNEGKGLKIMTPNN